VSDEDLVWAKVVAVGAALGWADDPLAIRGAVAGNRTGSRVRVTAAWARQRIPLTRKHRALREGSAMNENNLPANYLALPPNIDVKDMVVEVNTKLTEVEHSGESFDDRSNTE
jgi:hypothetical protein